MDDPFLYTIQTWCYPIEPLLCVIIVISVISVISNHAVHQLGKSSKYKYQ